MSEFTIGDRVRFKLNREAGEFIVIGTCNTPNQLRVAGFVNKEEYRTRLELSGHEVELEKVAPGV